METNILLNSHSNASLASVLAKLQAAAAQPFSQAYPMPAAVNHSKEFYNHEYNTVFMREWICVGRTDEITTTGDYLTHDIAGVPVLVVRQGTGKISGFVNACAHRFMCLVPKGAERFRFEWLSTSVGGERIIFVNSRWEFLPGNPGS